MKRLLLSLILFIGIGASVWADPTAKAIYCAENTTLYFTYDETTYTAGTAYENLDGKVATAVYNNISATGYTGQMHPIYYRSRVNTPWKDYCDAITTLKFLDDFKNWTPQGLDYYFMLMQNLETIVGGKNVNTSEVATFTYTFAICEKLSSLEELSTWDVSSATSLEGTFQNCTGLTTLEGLENWNTGNVTALLSTFRSSGITNVDALSEWDVSKVSKMKWTFMGCKSLINVDGLLNWDTSSMTDFYCTFNTCSALTNVDGLVNWDTSKSENIAYIFNCCEALENIDGLRNWDTSKATNMEYTLNMCRSLTSDALMAIKDWDVSNVQLFYFFLAQCPLLTNLDALSEWDTSKAENFSNLFAMNYGLTDIKGLAKWDVSNVITMSSAFYLCRSHPSLEGLEDWDISNVRSLGGTFNGCESLVNLEPIAGWNTAKLGSLSNTFYNCKGLTGHIDLSNWDLSYLNETESGTCWTHNENATNAGLGWGVGSSLSSTFQNCINVTGITLGNGNIGQAELSSGCLANTFLNCPKLRFIDFSYCTDTHGNIVSTDRDGMITGTNTRSMFYSVPLTTVIYLPKESPKPESGDMTNVVYSDGTDLKCDEYYSEDKVDIEFPHDFVTPKAIYTRDMSSEHGTVILPYEFKTNDNILAYTLNKELTNQMFFVETPTIPAHTPFAFKKRQEAGTIDAADNKTLTVETSSTGSYIFTEKGKEFGNTDFSMLSEDGSYSITVSATNTTSASEKTVSGDTGVPYEDGSAAITDEAANKWTTKGYYVNETVEDYSGTFYIAGDKFYKADGALTMYPHRVTFHGAWTKGDLAGSTTGAKSINFAMADVVTAIEAAEAREAEKNEIYDIQGRQQTKLNHGMNIVRMSDGSVRKVIVK